MTDKDENASKTIDEDDEEEEDEDADLQKLQAEIARMEEEAARITRETEELEQKKTLEAGGNSADNTENAANATKQSVEANSIYIGQVDYSATPEELVQHFHSCGTVERVTIVCDKFTGRPKGFAYMEFDSPAAVENAVKLDGSQFKGREIKVTPKRVNQPGFNAAAETRGGRGGRGRGGRGGRAPGRFYRGGRGAYRGGRASGFHPYY